MGLNSVSKDDLDARNRKYNSLSTNSDDVTPEAMEAYRMNKIRSDDPMAKYMQEKRDEEAKNGGMDGMEADDMDGAVGGADDDSSDKEEVRSRKRKRKKK